MKKHDFGKPLCRLITAVAIMMLSLQAMAYDFYYTYQGKTLYYNRTSGNTVEVTECWNNNYVSGDVVIPSTVRYNGTTYRVTSIGDYAFNGCSGLTSVTIGNSVTSIGDYAFNGCSGLTSITLPNRLTSIGNSAFNGCSGLTSVTIPNSVTSIGEFAFRGCSGLTSVTIPTGVTSIGEAAFSYCSSLTSINVASGNTHYSSIDGVLYNYVQDTLIQCPGAKTSVTIPNSVTSIGGWTFSGCSGLTSVTIPTGVTSIGSSAFRGCSGLTSVSIPNSVTSIGVWAFGNCSRLTSVSIPNSVTSIGESAFIDCFSLTSVTIPNSVTSIGEQAFSGCSGLTSVTIPNSVTSIGARAFWNCSRLTTLNFNAINCQDLEGIRYYYSSTHTTYYYYPFSGTSLTTVNIGDSVQRIPANFVRDFSDLTSVSIPNSVTYIGGWAFKGCSGLTSITIPTGVTSIGDNAFAYCSGLTTLNFNAINCQNFDRNGNDYYPFRGTSLTTVNIGDSVQRIPAKFVRGCSSLTSVTIPNSVTSIGGGAFAYCSGLTSVSIPNSVTSIGSSAFEGCSGLTSVTIPTGVTSIGGSAFEGCSGLTTLNFNAINCQNFEYNNGRYYCPFSGSLTTVNIGDSVQRIPKNFVRDCSSLTSVTIGNSVTSIGRQAFYGCSGLTSVTIPNSVTSIGQSAFENCSGLTSVTIPNGVTSIGVYAFSGCSGLTTLNFNAINCQDFDYSTGTSLTTVNIGDSVQRIPANFVKDCSGLTSIAIPNSVTSIGNYAFRGCSGLTSVRCLASVPPSIGSSSFSGISSTCTLAVSCVSLDAYIGSDWNTYFGGRILGDSTEEFPFELTASANDLTAGSVDISIGERCDQRILTATPESCYRFNAWSDGNRSNPRIITLTQDTAFTAYFDRAVYTQEIRRTICEGTSYTENGFNVSEAGTYTQNLQTVNGCDSIVTLTLTVNPVESTTLLAAICEGTSYTENGFNVSEAGTYTQNLQTINGCDSIVTLTLTVNPTYNITIDASINDGETYEENGFSESEAGTYVHTLQAVNGCDSVITLNLTVNSSLNDVVANAVEVRLYPNPAKSFVNLELSGEASETMVQLFDIQSKILRTYTLKNGKKSLRMELDGLPAACYYLHVISDNRVIVKKIIKNN